MTIALDQRFAVDGIQLAWGAWGVHGDTPLVLCHGFTGSAADFGLQIPLLAEHHDIMALDHRGHGLSTSVGDEAAYRLDRLSEDLAAWLAAVAVGPVDLLGHSMGGRLVLQVVLDHPELVRSLVLMDTSAGRFVTDDAMVTMMDEFMSGFDPSRGLPSFVSQGAGPEQDLIEATVGAAFLAARAERSAMCDPYAFRALGRQLFSPDLESLVPRLGELEIPVTVIIGSNDQPLVDLAPQMVASIQDVQTITIDGAYHSPQLTHPDVWRAAIESHLVRAAAVS